MLRRPLFFGVGALALLVALGAPGQLHAQRMRGGFPHAVRPGFHGGFRPGFHSGFRPGFHNGFRPGFHRGVFGSPFGPGPRRIFDPRFHHGFFDPRFGRGRFDRFGFGRFDRLEDRFANRFLFGSPFLGWNGGFFDPRVSMGLIYGTPAFGLYGGAYGGGGGYMGLGPGYDSGGGGYPVAASSPYTASIQPGDYASSYAQSWSMDLLDAMGVPNAG